MREVTTDVSMLERLVRPAGKRVVDIGCGGGALVRELAQQTAQIVGVEISEEQLAPALAADHGSGASYLIGRAQSLPLDDQSVDIAVFLRTLHHVSPPDLIGALSEARRVLRPGGVVYVAEPLPEGSFFALTALVEDELEVRAAAQTAVGNAAAAGLKRGSSVDYEVRACLAGVAAFRARTTRVDPTRADVFDAHEAEIAQAFERLGEPGERPGERWFEQPMRADVLRRVAGSDPTTISRRRNRAAAPKETR